MFNILTLHILCYSLIALGSVNQGDRIWFTWNKHDLQESFTLCKVQDNIVEEEPRMETPTQCCQQDSSFVNTMIEAGVYSSVMTNLGVETFKSSFTENEEPLLWCCVIAQPVAKVTSQETFFSYFLLKIS